MLGPNRAQKKLQDLFQQTAIQFGCADLGTQHLSEVAVPVHHIDHFLERAPH